MDFLRLVQIGFQYGDKRVLTGIGLDVAEGEFFGILGPNGSGKSTLLSLIAGLRRPAEGEIRIRGTSPAAMKRAELARRVAVVPQESSWIFPQTVEEVVLMGRTPHQGRFGFETRRDLAVARQAMEATDILALAARPIGSLSIGERQRVTIARALAQEPELILLDEPTAALDITHQLRTFDLIRSLGRSRRLTVVAVTHDINLAALYCDRLALLSAGRLRAVGPPADVLTEPLIDEVYGVRVAVDCHPTSGVPRVTLLGGPPPGRLQAAAP